MKVVGCRHPRAKLRSVEIVLRCDAGFLENMGTLLHNRRRTRGLPLWANAGPAAARVDASAWAVGLLGQFSCRQFFFIFEVFSNLMLKQTCKININLSSCPKNCDTNFVKFLKS